MNPTTAYDACLRIASGHYENFPVASHLLPGRVRPAVAAIYAYARRADDLADEGELAPQERLDALDTMESELTRAAGGAAGDEDDPVFVALADTIHRFELPFQPFVDLLDAFRQDVTVLRYDNFGTLLAYCRLSANPVGRLLLHLFGTRDERNRRHSDAICSALQLINFLQDVPSDYRVRGRIYLPQDEMKRFGVSERDIAAEADTPQTRALVAHQAARALDLLRAGAPLARNLGGRIGLELTLILLGGERIACEKMSRRGPAFSRPTLRARDWIGIVGRGLLQSVNAWGPR